MIVHGFTFSRLPGGWVHIMAGDGTRRDAQAVTYSPKEWARIVAKMGEAETRDALAPT